MAIADYAAFVTQCTEPAQRVRWARNGNGGVGASTNVLGSLWLAASAMDAWGYGAASAPSTAVALTSTDLGSLDHWLPGTGTVRLLEAEFAVAGGQAAGDIQGAVLLYDRLSHQGGLVGNLNTVQSTNLPTAALTRYTTGDGVLMAVEIYTALGVTGTTLSCSYTDQAGGASTSQAISIASVAKDRTAGRFIPIPLADGDTGVRAVADVTLAATTGTAGNFGVTLFKPLALIPLGDPGLEVLWNGFLNGGGNLPVLPAGTTLGAAYFQGDVAFGITAFLMGEIRIGID